MRKLLLPILGCALSSFIFSGAGYANTINALYKKTLNNIVDNAQCSEQEFTLQVPRRDSDDDDEIQLYAARFSDDIFLSFSVENNVIRTSVSITPMRDTLPAQLNAFCVVSAVQAVIDPSKSINEYMKLDPKMYASAVKNGHYEFQSKKYEHSVSFQKDERMPTLTFMITPVVE
ncbi:hypothetical protein KKJ17_07600 [Xenorhabdus bovienii]|uniref:Uncharacterized protein n=1 Tax=Xenorhabdus bovienii str. kraussei Quebec TaxID=1398203 RepID=A0A077PJQ4_XENBV|nr:hypothetical protein [Xenorhabdus bovienii]MDE9447317.1 hypothetical protein [Xenorhabdus bovienii]MDE9517611.1 hypothetical protein [Xenorhabdus bovienii]CDH19949.1 exported hypothetical protein [Xenorhabdus bovienii str. kraussei Quebec]